MGGDGCDSRNGISKERRKKKKRRERITHLVVPVLEPPLDVRRRRILDVLLDVVERVLTDVRDPEVVMDEEATIGRIARLAVPHDHPHERGLTGAVRTHETNAGTQRHLEVYAREGIDV